MRGRQINLRQWMQANPIQRQEWLQAGVELDDSLRIALHWAYAFKDAVAHISSGQILTVYESMIGGSRA
jgi:anaerobic glycerol-3-phosphate dehydrogenase